VPLYTAPKGELAGTLTFRVTPSSAIDGLLAWRKPQPTKPLTLYPAGFTATTEATGAPYIAPLTKIRSLVYSTPEAGKGDVSISEGGIIPLVIEVDVSNMDAVKAIAPNANKLTLMIARPTGLVTGNFKPTATAPAVTFNGLIHQGLNQAGGFFIKGAVAGQMRLVPR